jgi:hypothetical protein
MAPAAMLQAADRRQAHHMKRDTTHVTSAAPRTISRPLTILTDCRAVPLSEPAAAGCGLQAAGL